MILGRFAIITTVAALLCTTVSAAPVTRVFDSTHHDLGSEVSSNNVTSADIEIFNHDFADNIDLPASDYSSHLTTIVGSRTRSISSGPSVFSTDESITDLGRHEIAAYLVSEYSHSGIETASSRSYSDDASADSVGESIRDILDPGPSPSSFSFSTGGSPGHESFLSSFHPGGPSVTNPGLPGLLTVVPEPRHLAFMLMGLLLLASGLLRKHLRAGRSGV